MKLTIERGLLMKVLGHVQSVVERRNTIPVLSNVKFDAQSESLSLNSTDMDIDIVETVPAAVETSGSTTAPAHTLFDIVRQLPEGSQVELDNTEDSQNLVLNSGRSKFTLSCLPTEDFPVLSGDELPHNFELPAKALRTLIDRTKFAISTEETRYYLNGIYIHVSDVDGTTKLRAVATDGHRLAKVEVDCPQGAESMPGVIVPRKAVTELRKLAEQFGENILVSVSDTRIRFSFDGVVFTTKLIDGTFPDYGRVIPTGNDKVLEVNTSDFSEAVSRVSAISSDKSRAIKLGLTAGNLLLSVISTENGSAVEELGVDYSADGVEIGFNSRYLLDITQQIEGDLARFTLADSASPTLVQDTSDDTTLYVLMPMRV